MIYRNNIGGDSNDYKVYANEVIIIIIIINRKVHKERADITITSDD